MRNYCWSIIPEIPSNMVYESMPAPKKSESGSAGTIMKPKLILCLALVLCGGLLGCSTNSTMTRYAVGDSPISIAVAVLAQNGERRIEYRDPTAHFHVIVSNASDKPKRIWREWCSWGYYGLTFEFTDEQGKKWVAKKKPQVWTRNFPDWWTLAAHESLVIDVYFGDLETWQDFPLPENGSQTVTMQAIFDFKPDDEARKDGIWTGRIASKADKFTFYHWKSDTK